MDSENRQPRKTYDIGGVAYEPHEPLTREKVLHFHRHMWQWIAEHAVKDRQYQKHLYFHAMGIPEEDSPHNDCFCCEYAHRLPGGCERNCPIEWPGNGCLSSKSPYTKYVNAKSGPYFIDTSRIAEFAAEIAALPEKKLPEERKE